MYRCKYTRSPVRRATAVLWGQLFNLSFLDFSSTLYFLLFFFFLFNYSSFIPSIDPFCFHTSLPLPYFSKTFINIHHYLWLLILFSIYFHWAFNLSCSPATLFDKIFPENHGAQFSAYFLEFILFRISIAFRNWQPWQSFQNDCFYPQK